MANRSGPAVPKRSRRPRTDATRAPEVSPEATALASQLWDRWKGLCFWNMPVKPAFRSEGEFALLVRQLRKCGTMRAWHDARQIEMLIHFPSCR